MKSRDEKWFYLRAVLIASGFGLLVYVSPIFFLLLDYGFPEPAWSKEDIALTERRGNLIVDALENYHTDHGKYPKELTQLIPKYLVSIPNPAVDAKEWEYWPVRERIGFVLFLHGSESLHFYDKNKIWFHDDGRL
ncbi:MAG: hypothetical protein AAGK14_05195 [Verrucomicrobiota bacterium]